MDQVNVPRKFKCIEMYVLFCAFSSYWPFGLVMQLDNSTNPEVIDQQQISNLPPKVLCRVVNVRLLVSSLFSSTYDFDLIFLLETN